MSKKVVDIVNEIILKKVEEEGPFWQKPFAEYGNPFCQMNLISKRRYSGINILLTLSQGFNSPYWVTSKQAKEKGGRIKREEWKKYTPIVFLSNFKKENESESGEVEIKNIHFMRFYQVYNIEQTEGLESLLPKEKETKAFFNPIECCEEVVSNFKTCPIIEHTGNIGKYSPVKDIISIPSPEKFDIREEYYSTLFHEIVHSTGHKSRRSRESLLTHDKESYSKEELIAEFGAAYLCGHCQIENRTVDNSAAYIKGWLKKLKNDRYLLISAASLAEKAFNYVLGKESDYDKK
jgi:antirestriction protein ArdC